MHMRDMIVLCYTMYMCIYILYSFIWETWLIHMRHMVYLHERYDSFIRQTWLILRVTQQMHMSSHSCVTRDIHMRDMTHSYVWHDVFICETWLIHMRATIHSYVRHDSFICVTWLIHTWDMRFVDSARVKLVWHERNQKISRSSFLKRLELFSAPYSYECSPLI